eukprot:TRINITY_DN40591_c0_g1_i1.p1 TRINITY_DN40591_c0_g1~~TRINITY_DN40591_c0_g1_i1.p1  ORF type:complete len:139 (+),score=21.40 TRINITY_DN40591_c0_g1_i1:58-474(+)
MAEYLPYDGEESELRDVFGEVFDTNITQMDFQDVLKAVFNHTQLVAGYGVVDRIDKDSYLQMQLYIISGVFGLLFLCLLVAVSVLAMVVRRMNREISQKIEYSSRMNGSDNVGYRSSVQIEQGLNERGIDLPHENGKI